MVRGLTVGTSLLIAAASGCSLIVKLDGLRGSDAAVVTDAASTWCQTNAADAAFCVDFDDPDAAAAVSALEDGGTVARFTADYVSPPASGHAAVPITADAGLVTNEAFFQVMAPANGNRTVHFEWQMTPEHSVTSYAVRGMYVGVTVAALFGFLLVRGDQWYATIVQQSSVASYPLSQPLVDYAWTHLALDVHFDDAPNGSFTLSQIADSGTTTLASASGIRIIPAAQQPTAYTFSFGAANATTYAPQLAASYDDLAAWLSP